MKTAKLSSKDRSIKYSYTEGYTVEDGEETIYEPEDWGVLCEIMFPNNIRIYTYKDSPTWQPKCKLNKDTSKTVKLLMQLNVG